MERYIKTDILAKIVFDKWQECDELKHIIPAIRNAVMCASTEDLVEVVRCKDCKWCYFSKNIKRHFCSINRYHSDSILDYEKDYCSFGK